MQTSYQSKQKNKRITKSLVIRFSDYIDKILIGFVLVSILLFILYPIISVISTSFVIEGEINFIEYKYLFNKYNLMLIKNSLWVACLTSALVIIISMNIAIYLVFGKSRKKRFIYNSLLLTMISPPFVGSLAFIMLFGRRGIITYDILGLSISPYGWWGVVIMQGIGEISFASIMLIGILKSMDLRIIQASRDLGATSFETIKGVIIPLSAPGILAVLFIIFTKSLSDFGTPIIIGGNFNVLATEAYLTVVGRGNLARASAMSVLLIVPSIIAFYFYRKSMSKVGNLTGGTKSSSQNYIDFPISKLVNATLGLITWIFLFVILIEYFTIFISAFTNRATGEVTFTFEYIKAFKSSNLNAFVRSVKYSLIAGFFASLIGILLSYYLERRKLWGFKFIEFVSSLPYIIPGTFFGLGYIIAFKDDPFNLTGTVTIVILNCIFRQISVGSKASSALFSRIDQNIELAAKDLSVPNLMILKDIMLPLLKPAFLSSFINAFTSTMTTVGAIIYLVSPGVNLATIELFNVIKNGNYGLGSVIACLIITVTFIVNIIAIKLMSRVQEA